MKSDYLSIKVTIDQAAEIARELYQIEGLIIELAGEVDFNFRIQTKEKSYLLKVSRPDADMESILFQNEILSYLEEVDSSVLSPKIIPSRDGKQGTEYIDNSGNKRSVRLLSWIDGRLLSSVNPQKKTLLHSLGREVGKLTATLAGFDYPLAHRSFEWDIAQSLWTKDYLHLFDDMQKKIVSYFLLDFESIQGRYSKLRKSVIHNDANDNNVVVSENLIDPRVRSIIDFGDTIHSQSINDLAVAIAYAVMNKPDVLGAALPVIKGYQEQFELLEEELEVLYLLVAMRLVISVTKSAINKKKEPENDYLLISEKPAWEVLQKWIQIDKNYAHFRFREACNLPAHPNETTFVKWAKKQDISIKNLFPTIKCKGIYPLDMCIESKWIGHETEYNDNDFFTSKLNRLQNQNPNKIIAGGYLEPRPIYITDAYKAESNNGPEYRSLHLGIDFWLPAETPVHAIYDGEVVLAINVAGDKEYGGLVMLKHQADSITFYTLYGHQSVESISKLKAGEKIKKGRIISKLGTPEENGNWASHLHFQILLDRLGYENDFPGVTFCSEQNTWKSICPDPNLLFNESDLISKRRDDDGKLIAYRKTHLGKSLSLSYKSPLKMVRGSGAFLIDETGRKYLDTVNNVAHVGHENFRVIQAGQQQMAVLNTNTRYLHPNINEFAEELLSTFPPELSVVHFVNSGSEANELALRMAYAYTGQKDMIAVEVGYHGNTSGCVDISSYKFNGKGGKGATEHTHIVPLPDAFRGMYRGENTAFQYAAHIQEEINIIKSKGRGLAAFICESIISCGGQIELPKHYLSMAYQAVRKAGGLCIADEVQVGCGRVGSHFWGFQLHDVIPDIVTIGKPIGNGHPLAAVVCSHEVADAFANGMEYFNTFGGNPVSCAIGTEVLRVIKEEKLQQNARKVGNYLKTGLKRLQSEFPIIGHVRGQGLFLGFELVDKNKLPLTEQAAYLANRMKDLGILMSTDGKDNNVLKIKPPIVFSIKNADELLMRLQTVFSEDFMQQMSN